MLALIGLAVALARDRPFAAAFVGWNPLLAVQFAGGGHNDALMMALVLERSCSRHSGGPVSPAPPGPPPSRSSGCRSSSYRSGRVEAYRQGRKVGHLGFAVAAGLIGAVAFWRYGPDWLGAFGNLSGQLRRTTAVTPSRMALRAGLSENAAVTILTVAFAAGFVWLLREAWRGRARLALCACFLLLTASWLVPWYAVWAVPLAAIERDRAAQLVSLGICAYLLRAAVPL